jgi:acyl-CoA thioesterase-1
MKTFRIFTLILLGLVSLYAHSQKTSKLLILGDSLSASYNIPLESGWVALLKQRLQEQFPGLEVVNASISGETTGNALKRLPDLLSRHQPAIVVIELGGNDGLRGFQLKQIKANLERMIQLSQQQGAIVVLTGIYIPPNYGPGYAQVFNRTYQQLASKYQTEFVPFILEGVATNPDLMQADGIHPTAEAQPILLDNMWPSIKNAIEQLK